MRFKAKVLREMRSPTTAFTVCLLGLLFTADEGLAQQTWSLRTNVVPPEILFDVVFTSGNTAVAVGQTDGADGTIVVSSDGGLTWAEKTSATGPDQDADLNAVFSSAVTYVAVGGDLGGGANDSLILTSPDRGATWVQIATTNIPNANGEDMNDGIFITSSIAIAVGQNEEILRSVDRGASWTEVGTGITGENLSAVSFSGATVVAVGDDQPGGGNPETIIRSVDSGATWAIATTLPNTGSDLRDVEFISPTTVIAVGTTQETILRSTDGGDTWTQIVPSPVVPNNRDLNAVTFSGATVVTVGDAAGGDETIIRSVDSGASFSRPGIVGVAEDLRGVLFLTSTRVLAAGANGTVFGSADGGATWTEQVGPSGGTPQPTTDQLEALAFNGSNNTLAVGSILLSLDQVTLSVPIPFFVSKWLLVPLLVGYAIYALNRPN